MSWDIVLFPVCLSFQFLTTDYHLVFNDQVGLTSESGNLCWRQENWLDQVSETETRIRHVLDFLDVYVQALRPWFAKLAGQSTGSPVKGSKAPRIRLEQVSSNPIMATILESVVNFVQM